MREKEGHTAQQRTTAAKYAQPGPDERRVIGVRGSRVAAEAAVVKTDQSVDKRRATIGEPISAATTRRTVYRRGHGRI